MTDHFARGALLSAALNALAALAALAVGQRAKLAGRAELAAATLMTWNFLVMCPVYALGLTGHLDARGLAAVSAPFFLLVLAVARGQTPVAAFARGLGRDALALAVLPLEAIAVCSRRKSFVTVGVTLTLFILAWTLWCAYLTPSWKQWDALWYHEPMVGFAIQNHGFAFVDLPPGGAQKINGYPRLCEMTQLWFVIFTDRRVIDMVNHIGAAGVALGAYLLVKRFARDPVVAMGLAATIVLMPACSRLLGSTYVDVHNAAFIVVGAYFATRPGPRIGDALLAALCLALAVGSKTMALVPVGILSIVAALRLLPLAPRRPLAVAGAIAFGVAVIGGSAAAVYVRNWVHFGNPFWPDFKYDNDKWGIHWPGLVDWGTGDYERGENRVDMNIPLSDLLRALYRIPYSVPAGHYDQLHEYGIAVTWVVLPMTVLVLGVLALVLARDLVGRAVGRPSWRAAPETWNLTWLVLTMAAILHYSPALWGARYQIAAVALALAIVGWAVGRLGFEALGDGVASALVTMGLVSFFWMSPRIWLTWSEARAFARIPFPQREFTPASAIDPTLEVWNGSPVTPDVGLQREKQLGPGATLAFPDWYGIYMALFWNNEFSNRVVYVPSGPDFLQRLDKSGAIWAYCGVGDSTCSMLGSQASGWESVGVLDVEGRGRVFRRVRW